MSYFNWLPNFVIGNLLPNHKRTEKTIDWLVANIHPLTVFHNQIFGIEHATIIKESKWSSQIITTEKILNEGLGLSFSTTIQNDIYIDQPDDSFPVIYFYNISEATPTYIYNEDENVILFNYNTIEYSSFIGFIVNVPIAINTSINWIKTLVNRIKISGVNYKIKEY